MIHLHTRSCYTLLESTLRVEEIIQAALANHQSAAAITEKNVMYSTMEFLHQCQKASLKPIVGLETSIALNAEDVSVILYAKNNEGLSGLFSLSSILCQRERKVLEVSEAAPFMENLILLTSGIDELFDQIIEEGRNEQLAGILEELQELSPDFFVSIALNDSGRQRNNNHFLKTVAHSLSIPTVALSRIDYLRDEDSETLRLLQAIGHGKTVLDPSLNVRAHRYWRTQAEMRSLYEEDDLAMTETIAGMIELSLPLPSSTLPVFESPGKEGRSSEDYLRALCRAGLKKRMNGRVPEEYAKRLDYELSMIIQMGFADYFLIVWDFIRYGRSQDILIGPGRGSAAGSLVAYCLGITHIDPIKAGLIFERFLNPERVSMPDIDTDIPDDRRDELIGYLAEKYSPAHVAHIVTFARLKARMALRDTARALNIHVRQADELCSLLGGDPNITLEKAYQNSRAFRSLVDSRKPLRNLYEQARKIEGLPRHISVHAGGIVLSGADISRFAPVVDAGMQVPAVQFTMEYLEEIGLIKFDLLGLKNLSVLQSMNEMIEKNYGKRLDLLHLPLDDPRVYQMLSKADTLGVFQLESDGIRQLLRQLKPQRFEDIAAVLALYRPGPMKNISLYLDARQNRNASGRPVLHPLLEPILKESSGIFLYQEQIMKAAQVIGSFSLAQADSLRKAMSKKDRALMDSYRSLFVQGAARKEIDEKKAREIFEVMERFADYGFNKSHSYAYALIVYQMAYIKAAFPLEFYQSNMESALGSVSKSAAYVSECRSRGIQIEGVDLNLSGRNYQIENGRSLRMPFTVIRNLGSMISLKIIEEREQRGPFSDLYSALARLTSAGVPSSAVESLIRTGAFDAFGFSRTGILNALERLLQYARMVRVDSDDVLFRFDAVSTPRIDQVPESRMDRSLMEQEAYGFYLSGHPAEAFRRQYQRAVDLKSLKSRSGFVEVIGLIRQIKVHRTKTGKDMAFAAVEDELGQADLAIMPKLYDQLNSEGRLVKGALVRVEGRKDTDRDSVLVNRIDFLN